ncbi:hypothetical protein [Spirosoma sp.]|uniref:hypothetical protein n=1 Tax=Spirosoma sp. TaxID=1899569 RepID=UPI00262F870B|nr:hypothetical protein [Spirosoma sp.]MCX6217392.1 hypothetical protein [Spirosoma sp.]
MLIREAGLPYTFLQPSFFSQNLSTTYRDEIRLRNEIFVPAAHGRTSFIDVRDISATDVLSRKITYANPSILGFIWQKCQKEKLPLGYTLIMAALYTVSKLGKAAGLTSETERLLKRPPITFRQFANDFRDVWN